MILYLDTSAFVPLLVAEPSSALCRRLWDSADDVVSSVALRPESASALWRAHHTGRITAEQMDGLLEAAESLADQMHLVTLDDRLSREAASFVTTCGLRGYDGVHAATGTRVVRDDGVAASGDRDLLAAWQFGGLTTCDINSGT